MNEAGRSALREWLTSPVGRATRREPFLLRVFFFEALPAPERRRLLASEIERHERQMASYREVAKTIPEQAQFPRQTLDFGIAFEETYLRWLTGLDTKLAALASGGSIGA
jgi:hypothetical protein